MTLTESERQSGPPADPQLPSPIPWSGSRPVKQDGPRWSPEPSRQDHDTQGQPWLLFPSFLFRPPRSHSTRGFSEMFLALEPDRVAGSTITAQALEQRKRPCSVTFPTPN